MRGSDRERLGRQQLSLTGIGDGGRINGHYVHQGARRNIYYDKPGGGNWRNINAWKKLEEISYTVFVDNLPESMSKSWLWQLFDHEGRVVDVYLSGKKNGEHLQHHLRLLRLQP